MQYAMNCNTTFYFVSCVKLALRLSQINKERNPSPFLAIIKMFWKPFADFFFTPLLYVEQVKAINFILLFILLLELQYTYFFLLEKALFWIPRKNREF